MIPKFRTFIKIKNAINPVQPVGAINFESETITIEQGLTFPFDKAILMQYTGLKDKNGVEIYEGDIVRVLDRLDEPPFEAEGHIVYEQDDCAFEIAVGFYRYSLHRTKFVEYEIIGNIYEHPELLEEQNK